MNNSGMENSQGTKVAKLQAQDWNPTPWDCLVPRSAWPAYSRIYSWDCVFPRVRKHCTFHVRVFHFHHKTPRNAGALFDSRARLKVLILVGRERKTEQPSLAMPAHLLQHSSLTTYYLWYFPHRNSFNSQNQLCELWTNYHFRENQTQKQATCSIQQDSQDLGPGNLHSKSCAHLPF